MPETTRVLFVEPAGSGPSWLDTELSRLSGPGLTVTRCGLLCEALLVATNSNFDLALVHVDLPDGRGEDVVALMASIAPELPLVAVGDPDRFSGAELIQAGAEDFVDPRALSRPALRRIVAHTTQRGGSRAHYRGVIARLPDPLIVVDHRGVIEFANHAAALLFGRASAQLAGRVFPVPVVNEAGRAETWIHHAAGAMSRVELAVVDAMWAGRTARLISIRDITQRHEAVAALHTEARKFEVLVSRIPGVVWTTDRELEVEYLAGSQLDSMRAHHAQLFDDDSAHPARLLGDDDEARTALEAAMAGASVYRQVVRDGRNWEVSLEPLRDDDDETLGVIGFAMDATEKCLMEAALSQAQKLEAVGQLAAGVAHELNTPMQYLNDNLQFLQKVTARIDAAFSAYETFVEATRGCEPEREALARTLKKLKLDWVREQSGKALSQSLEGVEQASRIVRAMKDSVHHGSGEMLPADVNKIVRGAVDVSRNEWKYVAEMSLDLDPELPMAAVRAGEISQVVLNLVVNAAHALAELRSDQLGHIRLSTRRVAEGVEIRVADDAGGIPEHVQSRIFDPFFTTKEVGKGTGQGLAIARRIVVDTHGGTLEFDTKIGKGTTFMVCLPLSHPDARPEDLALVG